MAGDFTKIELLKEIIAEHNDNDPRLDGDFRDLSDELKHAIRDLYIDLRREDRNGRGIVVLVMGKNIRREEDLYFFKDAILEPACLSLDRCDQPEPGDAASEVTRAYPQLVALTVLRDLALKPSTDLKLVKAIWRVIAVGQKSNDPIVVEFTKRYLTQQR